LQILPGRPTRGPGLGVDKIKSEDVSTRREGHARAKTKASSLQTFGDGAPDRQKERNAGYLIGQVGGTNRDKSIPKLLQNVAVTPPRPVQVSRWGEQHEVVTTNHRNKASKNCGEEWQVIERSDSMVTISGSFLQEM